MLESHIEARLVQAAKQAGGWAIKWTAPGTPGVPDRIVFMPNGKIMLVELKAPGKKQTQLQVRIAERLAALGTPVTVIDSKEAVDALFS